MVNRRLILSVLAATAVLAVAVSAGYYGDKALFLGYPFDVGLMVNVFVAIGSVSAAIAAVWVATSDRRDRKRERDVEDTREARTIIVSAKRPDNPLQVQVHIRNLSPRVIVNLQFVQITVEGHKFGDLRPTIGPFPVVATPATASRAAGELAGMSMFAFEPEKYGPTHPYFVAVRGGPNGEAQTITTQTNLTATVRWTDASGNIWQRTGSGPADASEVDLSEPIKVGRSDESARRRSDL